MPARDEDAKGQWRQTQVTRPMWFPSGRTCRACGTVNPKLKRERMWACPSCGARHDRNLNAAINLRNLIMPVGRSRSGRGQDAVARQTPWDSWHSEPGVVKEVPPLRECERGTHTGTEVEGSAWGSRNNRSLNAAINPSNSVMPSGRRRDGRVQEEVVPQGPVASRQGHPGSVPKRKPLPVLEGGERETQARRPEAWSQGHRKPTATTNLGNLGIPSGRAPD